VPFLLSALIVTLGAFIKSAIVVIIVTLNVVMLSDIMVNVAAPDWHFPCLFVTLSRPH
jgi:hypothetical protein